MTVERLQQYIHHFMQANELPGLSVAVIKGGKILLADGFGVRSVEDSSPVTSTSLYHMASVSKPFSATAIMQLVEKGQIDLDARLIDYLPYFEMDDERYTAITIRQMLNHISGMPDVWDYEWGNPYIEDDALERYARSLSDRKLMTDPGTTFAYSNITFELLGEVISKVSGLTFEEYMRRNIFQPLGMRNSTFLRAEVPDSLSMTPHTNIFGNEALPTYPYNRAHAPSSTFHTNAEDACRWMQANLNRGELNGIRILQAGGYDQLWKSYFPVGDGRQIGLSWFLGNLHGWDTVDHGGSDSGFRSMLLMVPGQALGVTVMSNVNEAPMKDLATALAGICMGFSPETPRIPIFFPVIREYLRAGFDAAMQCIKELKEQENLYLIQADRFSEAADQLFDRGHSLTMDMIRLGLAVDPNSASLHAFMALEYDRQGETEKVEPCLNQAVSLDPENYVVKYVQRKLKEK